MNDLRHKNRRPATRYIAIIFVHLAGNLVLIDECKGKWQSMDCQLERCESSFEWFAQVEIEHTVDSLNLLSVIQDFSQVDGVFGA